MDRPVPDETYIEDGVEFTRTMLEAGLLAWAHHDSRIEDSEDLVASIYIAMEQARRHKVQNQ